MSENIRRTIQITYDTLNDMIRDTNLKPNMVVNTLGRNSVSDGYGSTYRIYAYEGPNLTIKGPLIAGGKLVGKEIAGTNSTDDIDNLKKSISSLSSEIEIVKSEETQKIIAGKAVKEVTDGLIENPIVDTITALDTTGVEINLLYNGQKSIFVSSEYGEEFDTPDTPEPFTTPTKVKEIIDNYLLEMEEPFTTPTKVKEIIGNYLLEMEEPFTNADDVNNLIKEVLDNIDDDYITSETEIRSIIDEYLKEKEESGGSPPENPDPDSPTEGEETGDNSSTGDGSSGGSTETPPKNPDSPTTGTEGEETGDNSSDTTDTTTNEGKTENEEPRNTNPTIDNENQNSDVSTESYKSDSEISALSETDESGDSTDSNERETNDEPVLSVINTPGINISLSEDKLVATVTVNITDFPWVLPRAFELSNNEITSYKVSEGITCEHHYYSDLVTFTIERKNRPEVIFYT